MPRPTQAPRLRVRRLAVALVYWLAVLVVSALLVLALLWFLEGRDESLLAGAIVARAPRPRPRPA